MLAILRYFRNLHFLIISFLIMSYGNQLVYWFIMNKLFDCMSYIY